MKKTNYQLITIPDKILRLKSKRIGFVDDEVKNMVESMKQITLDWDHDNELGVALAAIQVGIPERLAIVRNDVDDQPTQEFTTFVNPEIVKHSDEMVSDIEGCLSVPGLYGRVRRYHKIKLKATDLDGNPLRVTAEGFLARVFQHEIDHMNGVIFLDHLTKLVDLFEIDKEGTLTPVAKAPAGFEHIK